MSFASVLSSLWLVPRSASRHRIAEFAAVGYPKTGNTWLRVMLGRYVQLAYQLPELLLFDVGERAALRARSYRGPFGVFTHAPLEWISQTAADLTYENVVAPFRRNKLILIVRHPLDVLVSAYMQRAFQRTREPYRGSLPDFLEHPVHGMDKLLKFYQIWAAGAQDCLGLFIYRYEDAKAHPKRALLRLLEFLEERPVESIVHEAVEFASFESMRRLERSGNAPVYKSSGFKMFATGDNSNPNAYHVRKGKVGGYREEIRADLTYQLEARVTTEMPSCFGYSGA